MAHQLRRMLRATRRRTPAVLTKQLGAYDEHGVWQGTATEQHDIAVLSHPLSETRLTDGVEQRVTGRRVFYLADTAAVAPLADDRTPDTITYSGTVFAVTAVTHWVEDGLYVVYAEAETA